MQDSNALLVQQFRENDETAFSKLVRRHYPLVFRVCLKILGHRQDAEDVTQETFSRFAKHVDKWDVRRPLEPWLVTIAGNRSKTLLARRRAHQSLTSMVEPVTDEHTRSGMPMGSAKSYSWHWRQCLISKDWRSICSTSRA